MTYVLARRGGAGTMFPVTTLPYHAGKASIKVLGTFDAESFEQAIQLFNEHIATRTQKRRRQTPRFWVW